MMTAAQWSVWDVKKPARRKGFGKSFFATLAVGAVLFGGPVLSAEVVPVVSGYLTGSVEQRSQQAHEASQALAETGDERGTEAGERFVSNASGILTEVSNFIEDVKVSLAGEVR